MTKLLSIILSFTLIVSPMSFAQTEVPSEPSQESSGCQSSPDDSYAKQIASMGMAAVGTGALLTCKMGSALPSVYIFMAGSLAYIASELMGGKAQQQDQKELAAKIKQWEEIKARGGEVQLETMKAALKNEKDTLAFLEKRNTWMKAIAAIFITAAGMALVEETELMAWIASPVKWPMWPPMKFGACTPEGTIAQGMAVKAALAGAYSFGISASQCGMKKYATMGVAMGVSVTALGPIVSTALNTPMTRKALFIAEAAAVTMVAADVSSKSGKVKESITKLESLVSQFQANTQVTTELTPGTTSGSTSGATSGSNSGGGSTTGGRGGITGGSAGGSTSGFAGGDYDVTTLPDSETRLGRHCWSQNQNTVDYNTNCETPVTLNVPKTDMKWTIPTLNSASNSAKEMAQAIASGDMSRADVVARSLAGQASTLNDIVKSQEANINKARLARGEKAIDFDKAVKDQVASMEAAINAEAKKSGTNMPLLGNDEASSLADSSKTNSLQVNTAESDESVSVPQNIPTDGSEENVISEGLMNEGSMTSGNKLSSNSLSNEDGKNSSNKNNDISEDDDVSLFKQLSNRYQSNYGHFFKRRDLPAENAP